MKKTMDHERCSELLLPYLKGEVEETDREQIEVHLSSCDVCTEEKAALEGLLAVDVEPLTAAERRSLRGAVANRLPSAAPAREVISTPTRGAGWFTRAAPALGAVALIALAVVFAASLLSGGDDLEESAIQGLKEAEEGDGGGGGGAVEPEAAPDVAGEGAETLGKAVPYFKPGDQAITRSGLDDLPQKEPAFDALAGVTKAKAGALRSTYTSALSDQAPRDARAQVRECAQSVAASQGDVVPAFGAQGEYRGKEALLVGFVSGSNGGPLNRYMLWLWPKGSCDELLEYLSGPLKK